jgi:L,D-transpeptidase YcbB
LRLALERWRWRPTDFPRPPIVVNIPEFELRGLGPDYTPEIKMRVVVGKAFHHRTPVFTGNLSYVVFRPYWNVPLSIQRSELVPKILRDRGYLAKGNYEVTDGRGTVVTGGAIDDGVLAKLRAGRLFIRQKPGPKNSLGLVKFIFPNDNNVYLHDTPSVALFARARRDFSHGCIRVQDPTSLAVWVLRGKPGWDRDRVVAAMTGTTDNVTVTLDQPIPVLILYGTAVAPSDGKIYFYDDIYGYDAELEKVLSQGYPYP